MTRFFGLFAIVCSVGLIVALLMGKWPGLFGISMTGHILWGLSAALLTVSLHCLIFGIFTGSGKDTRLLVQDLKLNTEYVKRTKVFKRTVFPPALYAIGLVIITTSVGGFLAVSGASEWVRLAHQLLAWITLFYNLKVFWLEYQAVKENASIVSTLNKDAEKVFVPSDSELPQPAEGPELEWGTHVYAFGKFLCFLGYNIWLPYIYLRFIVGWMGTPLWLFISASLACLSGGYYLRVRYQTFRPNRGQRLEPVEA